MKNNRNEKSSFNKILNLLLALFIFIIPFSGLVLESFNIKFPSIIIIDILYIIIIILSIITKRWKVIVISTILGIILTLLTMFLSEILWYYLLNWFNIDISYR